jgi:DMSO/TMAO reductase YedYZ heme-binding membrane subunit
MKPFLRARRVLAGHRPGMRWRVSRVPAVRRHRASPALTATRHRALVAVLLAGPPGPLTGRGGAAPGAILASLQRFLLAYSGVFALLALTAAVAAGLAAADRLVVTPAGRLRFQAVHRALSLAAVGFLASHVLLQILAHHSRAIDAVVPFLASGRTLYLGLGTLASDLVLVIAVTGVARRGVASHWPATWRGVHVTAYLCWPLAIVHGLLSGRAAKPYVDWSYGACVAAVALALVVRLVAASRGRAPTGPHQVPAGVHQVPGRAVPAVLAALVAARRPGAPLPVHPPPRRALPGEVHGASARYGIVYGVVDDGEPRARGLP